MSNLARTLSEAREVLVAFGRRALLRRSLWGGAAVASSIVTAGPLGLTQLAVAAEAMALIDPKGDGFRRVVTSNNSKGKSYVLKDEKVKYGEVWRSSADQRLGAGGPTDPNKVLPDTRPATGQPAAETRFYYTAIQPAKGPLNRSNPEGMHRTSTLSYVLIANGELIVVLDEGEVTLKTGDLLVMRNAMHAWHNPTSTPVGMLIAQYLVS
ncbi:MAG: cupin domain-containing protein [Rhodospirillaceae bacterium]|nr:cupin domain-containing protein [Rhodospirillaceae bacterium]